jgi:hypothetical protein
MILLKTILKKKFFLNNSLLKVVGVKVINEGYPFQNKIGLSSIIQI